MPSGLDWFVYFLLGIVAKTPGYLRPFKDSVISYRVPGVSWFVVRKCSDPILTDRKKSLVVNVLGIQGCGLTINTHHAPYFKYINTASGSQFVSIPISLSPLLPPWFLLPFAPTFPFPPPWSPSKQAITQTSKHASNLGRGHRDWLALSRACLWSR